MAHTNHIAHDVIVVEDETLRAGFTQIPNALLRRPDLSPGAKLTYMGILSYAWQQGSAFPGQERLADDLGIGKRSIIRHLQELKSAGLLIIKRRGLRQTNIYVLPRLASSQPIDVSRKCQNGISRSATVAFQEVPERHAKKTQKKKIQVEQDTDHVSTSNGAHVQENVDNSSYGHQPQRGEGGRPFGLPLEPPDQAPASPLGNVASLALRDPTGGASSGRGRHVPSRDMHPGAHSLATAPQHEARDVRSGSGSEPEDAGMQHAAAIFQGRWAQIVPAPHNVPKQGQSPPAGIQLGSPPETAQKSHPGVAAGPSRPAFRRRRTTATPYIAAVMEDISAKLHDEQPRSSLTRAMQLWEDSGLDEQGFVGALYELRSVARQSNVRKRAAGGLPNRMPYFFALLEDRLGIKEHQHKPEAS